MKKKKVYIDTYESLYPVLLVVANEFATAKDVNKEFSWFDGEDVLESDLTGCNGCVLKLVRRSDKARCLFVKINNDKFIKGSKAKYDNSLFVAVHEACHVALSTYSVIEDKICTEDQRQEPFCYYTEWIFKCIYTTMMKK